MMNWKSGLTAVVLAFFVAAAPAFFAAASAQTYPSQTVKIVVAYAPGGTGDIVARLIATQLQAALGQNVVVENRAGATGAIGTQSVVSAAPDGHTLLLGQTGEIAINQHWIANLSYNAQKDLEPVGLASVVPLALVVPAKAPYSDDGRSREGSGGARSRSPSPRPAPARRDTSRANSSSCTPRAISPTFPTRARAPR